MKQASARSQADMVQDSVSPDTQMQTPEVSII